MKQLLVIPLLFITISLQAQSITFSPTSVPLWGTALHTPMISIEYNNIKIISMYATKKYYDPEGSVYSGLFAAVFYMPVRIDFHQLSVDAGVGCFDRRFPTKNGTYVNFNITAELQLSDLIFLQYSHISNGFGIQNYLNPGIDNIGLGIKF